MWLYKNGLLFSCVVYLYTDVHAARGSARVLPGAAYNISIETVFGYVVREGAVEQSSEFMRDFCCDFGRKEGCGRDVLIAWAACEDLRCE